jgi:hypothetical protein
MPGVRLCVARPHVLPRSWQFVQIDGALERDSVSFKSHHLLNTLFPDAGMLHSVPQYNAARGATLMIAPMSIVHHGPDGSARAAGARGQKNAILLHEHTPNHLVSYMPV